MARPKQTNTKRKRQIQIQAWLDPQNPMDSQALDIFEAGLKEVSSKRELIVLALLAWGGVDAQQIYLSSDAMLNQLYQMMHQMFIQMRSMQETIAQLSHGEWTTEQRQEIGQRSTAEFGEMEKSIGSMFKPMVFTDVDED